ncbi:class I SAM-dependent methyltransferase [Alkalinema pantanalense CENA528]|uniref:class I SAM-dependent methyltransferase n=1 Tax=Alkalinema pantanalense TaxID=1620705 RepID=UPI003D6EB232
MTASMIASNPCAPTFLFDDLALHWQMTRCERYALASLLDAAKPDVAIEIGTYQGGSLQVISRKAQKVYSIDISPDCKAQLSPHFSNVEFLTGSSQDLLPQLLQQIQQNNEVLNFVLIDGDHSTEGVRRDINAVLQYVPTQPLYIVFHDSFHPPCRQGILAADWQQCEYIHYVEIDFIPGVYHYEPFDTAEPRSMYGGLAVAKMLPQKRTDELVIYQSQKGLFDTIYPHSCHAPVVPVNQDLPPVTPLTAVAPATLESSSHPTIKNDVLTLLKKVKRKLIG